MPHTNLENSADFTGQNFYVGIDVHKKSWSVTLRTSQIEVAHFTQPPQAEILAGYLKKKYPGAIFHSAYEAGFCGTSAHEKLCQLGINNMVIHAADIPATDKQRKNKTDLHDSRAIANYLEKGEIHGIHILSNEQQELRSLYRLREGMVRQKIRANNHLKSFLMYRGITMPDMFKEKNGISMKMLKWLDAMELYTQAGTRCLKQYIEDYRHARQQVLQITRELRQFIEQCYPIPYKLLLSIPGYGPIVCMALLAEIGDFKRFKEDPSPYCSYLGLIPWEQSSGDTIRIKGPQPRCNTHLRSLLVEAAWIAIRKDTQILAYYQKHVHGGNKHAIIKVARKLSLIARGVVLNNTAYDPAYGKKTPEKKERRKRISENIKNLKQGFQR